MSRRTKSGQSGISLRLAVGTTALALAASLAAGVSAQDRPVPDKFEATTHGMTPDGLKLSINVLEWSDRDGREAVVAALESGESVSESLAELPTLGVVWREGSGVGHSIKYALRSQTDSGESITVVTDKPLDSYSFRPWSVEGQTADAKSRDERRYSVIELRLDGDDGGIGSLSLGAEVMIDADDAMITLSGYDPSSALLVGASELPKPYWATDSG